MDLSALQGVPPQGGQSAPQPIADLRPTADAAVIAKGAPQPLPIVAAPPAATTVPATTEAGAVARARLEGLETARPVEAPERVLKPFGISMLPDAEARQRAAAAKAEAEAQAERSADKADARAEAAEARLSVARQERADASEEAAAARAGAREVAATPEEDLAFESTPPPEDESGDA
ncbi:hypothetical protein ACXN5S_06490 [Pseudoroseicyclus sp. H15]